MKRVFCLLLAASLFLLTGCFGKSEGEETSSENPAPTVALQIKYKIFAFKLQDLFLISLPINV